jgi:hypothetical protein
MLIEKAELMPNTFMIVTDIKSGSFYDRLVSYLSSMENTTSIKVEIQSFQYNLHLRHTHIDVQD